MQTDQALHTERLRLRDLRADDAPRIADLANDLDVARMTTRIAHPYALSDAEDFIAHQERYRGDGRAFAIEHPADGLMGVVGLSLTAEQRFPVAGYWLGRPYWGKGFATEALAGALSWARRGLGARAVAADHFVDNPASAWVLTKAGFLYTGEVVRRRSSGRGAEVLSRKMIWLA